MKALYGLCLELNIQTPGRVLNPLPSPIIASISPARIIWQWGLTADGRAYAAVALACGEAVQLSNRADSGNANSKYRKILAIMGLLFG